MTDDSMSIIDAVANRVNLPSWWVEAIAIEYCDCRDYAIGDEIWTFNFSKMAVEDLLAALEEHHIVSCHGLFFHNVRRDVTGSRILSAMVEPGLGIASEPDDVIPEGPISDSGFLFQQNPIEVWDPKLDFSEYVQMYYHDRFWQWHFAKFVHVEGRHYGKMVSDIADLEPMDELQEELRILRNNKINPGMNGYDSYQQEIKAFYERLDQVKEPILSELMNHYINKINTNDYIDKTSKDEPPQFSRFERFRVNKGHFETQLFAEPIFYRACCEHSKNAEEVYIGAEKNDSLPSKLDEVYQERASAIIMGAACLEAYLNNIGYEDFDSQWKEYERVEYLKKWKLYFIFLGKREKCELGKEPFQLLTQLNSKRDYLMHYKPFYCEVKPFERHTLLTATEIQLNREFVRDLPKKIGALVRYVSSITGKAIPYWITVG